MQLYEPRGQRKYLTPLERDAFLRAALASAPEVRTFWETLAYTGCRISEALAMDPSHIDLEGGVLFLETLKKRRTGVYRAVPVPGPFLKRLDLVHNVRTTQQNLREGSDSRL